MSRHQAFFVRLVRIIAVLGAGSLLAACSTMDYAGRDRSQLDSLAWNSPTTRQTVAWDGREKPGTIVIATKDRTLYLVQPDHTAIQYMVGVGRPGFQWAGVKSITRKEIWADWTPPPQMHQRQHGLPVHMAGGIENPLGARSLYLGSSLYRIHGASDPNTIGQEVSSGCIRMNNADVMDLYERVHVGTPVIVRL